jgi:hypothetical protein
MFMANLAANFDYDLRRIGVSLHFILTEWGGKIWDGFVWFRKEPV